MSDDTNQILPEGAEDITSQANEATNENEEDNADANAAAEANSDADDDSEANEDLSALANGILKNRNRETGKVEIPEGTPEAIKLIVQAEEKSRGLQSIATKSADKVNKLEAENKRLYDLLSSQMKPVVSEEQQAELNSLLERDPEAWRRKMNELEKEHTKTVMSGVKEDASKAFAASSREGQLKERAEVLTKFHQDYEDITITNSMIENDIPQRIVKDLEKGEVTFEEFLHNVRDYMLTGKRAINPSKVSKQANISNINGASTPTHGTKKSGQNSYEKAIY